MLPPLGNCALRVLSRLALLGLVCASPVCGAEQFAAKVIVVLDGDTVLVLRGEQKVRIRLANIDAPEKAQSGGMASRASLSELVLRKNVQVDSQAIDQYGRTVATLRVDGQNVNEEQVRRGMAWEYSHHHRDRRYIALQREAQAARRGLWAEADPMPPWHWRKLHPDRRDRTSAAARDARCGAKRYCSQMASCAEAMFYLKQCGLVALDANRDGVPCEALCGTAK